MLSIGRWMRDLGGELTLLAAFTTLQGTLKALMIFFLRVNFTVEFNMWVLCPSTFFSPTFLFLKLLVIEVFVCKQEHFPVTVHFSLHVWMCRDRQNPVGDIIIIPTIAYYKLSNKLWQILGLVCLIVLYKKEYLQCKFGLMTQKHLGGKQGFRWAAIEQLFHESWGSFN